MDKALDGQAAPWVVFAFIVLSVILAALVKFALWYARNLITKTEESFKLIAERLKQRENVDSLFERRLESGAKAMSDLRTDLAENRRMVIDLTTKYLERAQYERDKRNHDEIHRVLDCRVVEVEAAANKLLGRFEQLGERVETGFTDFRGVLAKHVDVPRGGS